MRAAGRNADVFGRAWQLFARNLSIVVPGLVAGALTAVLEQLLTTWLWIDVTQIVAAILTISYTTGMADAAWRLGRARFSDGRRAFRRDGRHVLVAMLALMLLGAAAAVLAPYTFSFSIAAYVFFCIYTLAAAVVGERPGFLAVVESPASPSRGRCRRSLWSRASISSCWAWVRSRSVRLPCRCSGHSSPISSSKPLWDTWYSS